MELGSPPLYAELNRVSRMLDYSQLEQLGPLHKAFSEIAEAENAKEEDEKITTGFHINPYGVKYNLAGIFLLYRGAQMNEYWVNDYAES